MIEVIVNIAGISSLVFFGLMIFAILTDIDPLFEITIVGVVVSIIALFVFGGLSIINSSDPNKPLNYKQSVQKWKLSEKDFLYIKGESVEDLQDRVFVYMKERNDIIRKNKNKTPEKPVLKTVEYAPDNKYKLEQKHYNIDW